MVGVCLVFLRVLAIVRSSKASGGVVSRELRWALSWVSSQVSVCCCLCRRLGWDTEVAMHSVYVQKALEFSIASPARK